MQASNARLHISVVSLYPLSQGTSAYLQVWVTKYMQDSYKLYFNKNGKLATSDIQNIDNMLTIPSNVHKNNSAANRNANETVLQINIDSPLCVCVHVDFSSSA